MNHSMNLLLIFVSFCLIVLCDDANVSLSKQSVNVSCQFFPLLT